MAELLEFSTARFDPAREEPNPINPIAGHALLTWLAADLRAHGYAAEGPEPEDWGWYLDVSSGDRSMMIGASGEPEAGGVVRWILQIHGHRTFWDKVRGRNALTADDPLVATVASLLRAQPDFSDIVRTGNA